MIERMQKGWKNVDFDLDVGASVAVNRDEIFD